jgi:hypothetical protein
VTRLLVLSDERAAAELRQAQEQAAAARAWQRATRKLILRCGLVYAAGTFLGFSSMGLTGDLAQVALWGGFLLGNGAWFTFLIAMWVRETQ